ncbi:MAG: ribonuclease III [Legionellaceae bacterium]
MNENEQRLCRRLGYDFQNKGLLKQALTHRSASHLNNERFEFLGDSLLGAIISYALMTSFPQESEGQLSRLRAYLVKGEMLAVLATELHLGDCLHLGQGELKSGGFRRASILADAFEAIIAAVFLDGGFDACQNVVLKLYEKRLLDEDLQNNLKDWKTQLQEHLQAHQHPLPDYVLVEVTGEEHEQLFHITCEVKTLKLITQGLGETRRKAEQKAARDLLSMLKNKRNP